MFAMDPQAILKIIQAAVAPVVLISGVGLLLLTLSARLGRIVDRLRLVAELRRVKTEPEQPALHQQMLILWHRAQLIRLALTLSVLSVAILGTLITLLFVGLILGWNVTFPCIFLFVASLLCVVAAMAAFVVELFESLTALKVSLDLPGYSLRAPKISGQSPRG